VARGDKDAGWGWPPQHVARWSTRCPAAPATSSRARIDAAAPTKPTTGTERVTRSGPRIAKAGACSVVDGADITHRRLTLGDWPRLTPLHRQPRPPIAKSKSDQSRNRRHPKPRSSMTRQITPAQTARVEPRKEHHHFTIRRITTATRALPAVGRLTVATLRGCLPIEPPAGVTAQRHRRSAARPTTHHHDHHRITLVDLRPRRSGSRRLQRRGRLMAERLHGAKPEQTITTGSRLRPRATLTLSPPRDAQAPLPTHGAALGRLRTSDFRRRK